MRKLFAMGLTLLLCWQPMGAVAADLAAPAGPVTASVSREASRLASEADARSAAGWQAMRELAAGRRIVITTQTTTVSGSFVAADAAMVTVRNGDVMERLNAEDVVLIAGVARRGSAGMAVLGALGGIFLGSGVAVGLAESTRCSQGCGGRRLAIWSTFIGLPIAGGYGAWYASSRVTEEVIYRRP
jgi:hypothetical protein